MNISKRLSVIVIIALLMVSYCKKEELQDDEASSSSVSASTQGADIVIVESDGATSVIEGDAGGDSYSIALKCKPESTVSIKLNSYDGQLKLLPATVNFTPGNYDQPQTIKVTAINDEAVEGTHTATIEHKILSGDADYINLLIQPVSVSIQDDDTPGIAFVGIPNGLKVQEGGTSEAYQVRLLKQPSTTVFVSITAPSTITLSVSQLTFSATNYSIPQTVIVTAKTGAPAQTVDANGDIISNASIVHTAVSSGSDYNGQQATLVGSTNPIIFVDKSNSSSGDGKSWATAFSSLQGALAVAKDGQQVWMADGVYKPSTSDRTLAFTIVNSVQIYGGFSGSENNRAAANPGVNRTVLSGDIGGNDYPDWPNILNTDNSHRILRITSGNVVLSGMSIEGGNSTGASSSEDTGAAMRIDNASVTGYDLTIRYHYSPDDGGAISIDNGSTITLQNSDLSYNQAADAGGALVGNDFSSVKFTNTILKKNVSASLGGAVYMRGSATLYTLGSKFEENSTTTDTAGFGGGAIYGRENTNQAIIEKTEFLSNTAANEGGAIYVQCGRIIRDSRFKNNIAKVGGALITYGEQQGLTITNSTFEANSTNTYSGGAIYAFQTDNSYPLKIEASVFRANTSATIGGALRLRSNDDLGHGGTTIINSVFDGNEAGTSGGGIYTDDINLTIDTSYFIRNKANGPNNYDDTGGTGGAITNKFAYVTIKNSLIANNQAKAPGGGFFMYAPDASGTTETSSLYVDSSTVSGNTANSPANAAIRTTDPGSGSTTERILVTIKGSIFTNNDSYFDNNADCSASCNSSVSITDSMFETEPGKGQTTGYTYSSITTYTGGNPLYHDSGSDAFNLCTLSLNSYFIGCTADTAAIDAAPATVAQYDLYGNVRTGNSSPDFGAFERQLIDFGAAKTYVTVTEGSGADNFYSASSVTLTSYPSGSLVLPSGSQVGNVFVSATDDCDVEPEQWSYVTLDDGAGNTAKLPALVKDNDSLGAPCLLKNDGGSTIVANSGTNDSIKLTLAKKPVSDVTVTLANSSGLGLSAASFVFTPSNWNQEQALNITANGASPGTHSIVYSLSSSDTTYNGLSVAATGVVVSD